MIFAITHSCLSRKIHCTHLPDHDHLDLPRVLQLLLETTRDLFTHLGHSRIVDPLGIDHDADLTTRLVSETTFYTLEALSDLFQLLESLEVGLEHITTNPGTTHTARINRRPERGHIV